MTDRMTKEQYDKLIAEGRRLNIPGNPERWAWNRAASLGLHPELSGIAEPPMSKTQSRQSASDWHDERSVSRNWLARRA